MVTIYISLISLTIVFLALFGIAFNYKKEYKKPLTSLPSTQEEKHQNNLIGQAETILVEQLKDNIKNEEKNDAIKIAPKITKKKNLQPIKRGGRSRVEFQTHMQQKKENTIESILKPEIICWEKNSWIIGIEIPQELSDESIRVFQGECELKPENSSKTKYQLVNYADTIIVQKDNITIYKTSFLSENNYYVFKMKKDWKSPGRLVKYPSKGFYIIIAPETWERNESISDAAPIYPEYVENGLKAHFFEINQKCNISFVANGSNIEIKTMIDRFFLKGTEVIDDNELMGPLFINAPILTTNAPDNWKSINSIIIGEEGRGRNRWRTSIKPEETNSEIPLNVLEDKSLGWFFIRIYDINDQLIESFDLRYCKGLRTIEIPPFMLPNQYGYENLFIKFTHDNELMIRPKNHNFLFEESNEATIFNIPSESIYDLTDWEVSNGTSRVQVSLNLNRIWWTVSTEQNDSWKAVPLKLSPEDFLITSKKNLWIKFSKEINEKIAIGITKSKSKNYSVISKDHVIKVPLRDFTDYEDWRNFSGEKRLFMQFKEDNQVYNLDLAIIRQEYECKWCKWSTSSLEQLCNHFIENHINEFFRKLPYSELINHLPNLPKYIYKCQYCGFYATSSNHDNPTEQIIKHIEAKCKVVKNLPKKIIEFQVIHDINEIRINVLNNLHDMFYCKLCFAQEVIEEEVNESKRRLEHLLKAHQNDIRKEFRVKDGSK